MTTYGIRRREGDRLNYSNLLPVLFNLIDCNLNLKNYSQAKYLIDLTSKVISQIEHVDPSFVVDCYAKKAKLNFYLGHLEESMKECQVGLRFLEDKRC